MSIKIKSGKFQSRIKDEMKNEFMREAVKSAQDRLQNRRNIAAEELGNWEDWRAKGESIRSNTIQNLHYYLELLSKNVKKVGGNIYFAETADEANEYILAVAKKKKAKSILKSKSMVTEEIGLNKRLEEINCEVIETDLGEYILQVDDNDPPSHIVAPALHKNKEQIRDVFREKIGYTNSEMPEELAMHARKTLREKFLHADIGITGCNFAVAETGSVCLVTNEGNARMVTTYPKTQITVMGMERVVPSLADLDIMVSLLTRSAVGQKLSSYVTVLTGPRRENEIDGPEEFHLVVIDNGRSKILGTEFQSVLNCIRCAACINVCPVYRHIGGHSYGSIYPGPIGAVLTPLLDGYKDHKELPYASTLCAACTDVCPVKIPLHKLLLKHRHKIVEIEGKAPISEKVIMKAFGVGASSESIYKYGSIMGTVSLKYLLKNRKKGPLSGWTNSRELPRNFSNEFRDWYIARKDK